MKMKWVYWSATGILALMYLAGAAMYLSNISGVQQIFGTLGYPAYLVPILAVAKLAGAVVILWRFSVALSDLAYAGMFFHLLLALSAHINVGDGGFVPAIVGTDVEAAWKQARKNAAVASVRSARSESVTLCANCADKGVRNFANADRSGRAREIIRERTVPGSAG